MDVDTIRNICKVLPLVTEGIKWGNDLCFMVAGKMFCVISLDIPLKISFKVSAEEFDELSSSPGIIPAPYAARHKWVMVEKGNRLNKKQWERYITGSYKLVREKIPKSKFAEPGSKKLPAKKP